MAAEHLPGLGAGERSVFFDGAGANGKNGRKA